MLQAIYTHKRLLGVGLRHAKRMVRDAEHWVTAPACTSPSYDFTGEQPGMHLHVMEAQRVVAIGPA